LGRFRLGGGGFDVDDASYEELLDRFEDVKVGLSPSVLHSLPTYGWKPKKKDSTTSTTTTTTTDESKEEAEKCVVCMCEFELEEEVRQLPCTCRFHTPCIDRWFEEHHVCPICRFDVALS
jgi:hypothetical protein